MFYPAEMHKVTIGIHRRYSGPFLQSIHEAGIIELTPITEGEHLRDLIDPVERDELRQKVAAAQSRAERAVDVLADQKDGEQGEDRGVLPPGSEGSGCGTGEDPAGIPRCRRRIPAAHPGYT